MLMTKPVTCKLFNCFTDRGTACVETGSNGLLDKLLARTQLSGEDALLQNLIDLILYGVGDDFCLTHIYTFLFSKSVAE